MKSFSLRRVAQYARYHYSVTRFHYLSFILAVIALPSLFGILSHNLHTAVSMLVAIYVFGGIAVAVSTTRTMRGRGTKIMDGVLPVSTAERQVFNVVNLAVAYPAVFALASALILGVVAPFQLSSLFFENLDFCSAYALLADEALLYWPVYVFVQIVCSTSLLINICARRSLILTYLMLFIGFVLFMVLFALGMEWLSDNVAFNFSFNPDEATKSVVENIVKAIYAMTPVAIYTLGYVALRKRQVKW